MRRKVEVTLNGPIALITLTGAADTLVASAGPFVETLEEESVRDVREERDGTVADRVLAEQSEGGKQLRVGRLQNGVRVAVPGGGVWR